VAKSGNIDDGLRAALQTEREVAARLNEIRGEIQARIAAEVAAGKPFVNVALATFKFRVGRNPSMPERLREAKRLQKQQQRATRCRQEVTGSSIAKGGGGVGSSGKESPMSRLVKRITSTTTEEFAEDERGAESDEELDCADDKSAAAEDADDEDEGDDEDEDENE
jgi:hypothetical protein